MPSDGTWGSLANERTVLAAMWLSDAAGRANAEVVEFVCMCTMRQGRVGLQEYLLANPDHHAWDVSTIRRAGPIEKDCGIARWMIIESPTLVALVRPLSCPCLSSAHAAQLASLQVYPPTNPASIDDVKTDLHMTTSRLFFGDVHAGFWRRVSDDAIGRTIAVATERGKDILVRPSCTPATLDPRV
jgi:hypothetical protein